MSLVLETERLRLRLPEAGDAAAITRGLSNFEVTRWLAVVPYPYALSDAEEWLAGEPGKPTLERATFMIELPSMGVIGAVGIAPNLGYWMSQEHWGRGYMTEAAERLVAWYFAVTDAPDVIHCSARLENAASRAVQRKLGFREIGTSEGFSRPLNEPYTAMQTELDRKAFEERGR